MSNAVDVKALSSIGAPWPNDSEAPLLFILCGEDVFERDLLRDWVQETRPQDAMNDIRFADVDAARDETPDHRGVFDALSGPDDRIVIPLGVAWKAAARRARILGRLGGATRVFGKTAQRKRRLAKDPKACILLAGEPATLADLRHRFERKIGGAGDNSSLADYIARQAVLTIDRESRKAEDAPIKLPRFIVPAIMGRREFHAELETIAAETNSPIEDVERHAEACLKEIAPKPAPVFVNAMARFSRMVCGMGYDPDIVVNEEEAAKLGKLVREHPTALLFTHKSHVDGLALIDLAYRRRFPLLHMIGGINMAFFGVGSLAKHSGAVFIRRSFQDDAVYKAALRHYISYILEKRFPVAWSLEGTRSRIGKLMPPRYGILKYVVEAAEKNEIDDLHLVPVSIYYDLIPEIASYASEQAGATKRKESLAWFVGFVAGMRKPLGRIFMDFGEPIRVNAHQNAASGEHGENLSLALHRLAFKSAVHINRVTPLTASGLLAFILISAAPRALTRTEIGDELRAIRDWAHGRDVPLTKDLETADERKIRHVAQAMIDVGVLEEYRSGIEPLYGIPHGEEFTVSYYRNTVIHHFLRNAIIELALVATSETTATDQNDAFWNAATDLRDLFKFEFFYPPTLEFKERISEELDLQNANWRNFLAEGKAEDLLGLLTPLFAHGTLKPYIEAYSVVGDAIVHLKPGEAKDEKAIISRCLKMGRDAVLRRRISGEESIAKLLYANGYRLAVNRGLLDGEPDDLAARRKAFARQMREFQRRLQLIEAIALRRRAAKDLDLAEENETALARAAQ